MVTTWLDTMITNGQPVAVITWDNWPTTLSPVTDDPRDDSQPDPPAPASRLPFRRWVDDASAGSPLFEAVTLLIDGLKSNAATVEIEQVTETVLDALTGTPARLTEPEQGRLAELVAHPQADAIPTAAWNVLNSRLRAEVRAGSA